MFKLQRYTDLTLRNNLINTSNSINCHKLSKSDRITRKRNCPKSISQFCIKCKQLKRLYSFLYLKSNDYKCPKSEQLFATNHFLSKTVQCLMDGRRRSRNLIFFKFIIEGAAADSEVTGSLAFVPITLLHNFQQMLFFVFNQASG